MKDKKNIQLSDEMLMGANGGLSLNQQKQAAFDAIGKVVMHLGGRLYQVRFSDGAELVASSQADDILPANTQVGLYAVTGGWILQVSVKR
ncbi:MAG: hypothetical protein J5943_07525 [Oribacterium sp.]|nr:hypothetical protein [Oribacterium sp.]MBR1857020.1 hypothetical protein [Oribacterium sp.]